MNRRSGFTLMELLLVVAVLAIVAAAAAPTFFGGASAAMAEAKKASFMSCWTTTMGGTSTFMSLAAAKGSTPAAGNLDTQTVGGVVFNSICPDAARKCKAPSGVAANNLTLIPVFNTTGNSVNILVRNTTNDVGSYNDVDLAWAAVSAL